MSKSEIVPVLPILPGSPSEEVNETWEKLIDNRCQGSIESCAQRTTVMTRCWLRKDRADTARHPAPNPLVPNCFLKCPSQMKRRGKWVDGGQEAPLFLRRVTPENENGTHSLSSPPGEKCPPTLPGGLAFLGSWLPPTWILTSLISSSSSSSGCGCSVCVTLPVPCASAFRF